MLGGDASGGVLFVALWIVTIVGMIWLSYRDDDLPISSVMRVMAGAVYAVAPVVVMATAGRVHGVSANPFAYTLAPVASLVATLGRPALLACLEKRDQAKLNRSERVRAHVGIGAYFLAILVVAASESG